MGTIQWILWSYSVKDNYLEGEKWIGAGKICVIAYGLFG